MILTAFSPRSANHKVRTRYGILAIISACILLLILVVFRRALEATPATHMVLLLPALAYVGALFAKGMLPNGVNISEANANAVTCASVWAIFFWMLPRYIDASLVSPWVDLLKFTSIPIIIGGGLALSWRKTNPYLRGFLQANALSMLGVLAFLYTYAPVRICNSYLVSDQKALGGIFLGIAAALSIYWCLPLFLCPKNFNKKGLSTNNAIT